MKEYFLPGAVALLAAQGVNAVELEPMLITATRTAQTADETLASVSVITRADIERKQARSVQDLIRGLPGVSIGNNGGSGKSTSFFLRGTESDHVLVLVNGIKTGSATLGTTAFQHIPVAQIERIELVRGPRSSLYGSEAIGGVIQIFTRTGGGELMPFFTAEAGSDDTYRGTAGISGGGDKGWFNLSFTALDTRGFNACDGRPAPGAAGCFTDEPDSDGNRDLSGSLRAGYRFDNGVEIDFHALQADAETEFDGSFVNESETVQQVIGGTLRYSPTDSWLTTLTAGRSRDKSDNFKDNLFLTRFDTKRTTISLQNDFHLGDDHLLTLGADYQKDKVDSTTAFAVTSRDNKALFAQFQTSLGDHELQFSLRRDDNEQFGGHNTGGISWGYDLTGSLRLTASYGTAFKAPTFNELYFPGFGNAALDPETSRSFELGVNGSHHWGRWSLNAYETRIDDLIAFDSLTFAPANIEEARILGLEAAVTTRLAGWDLNLNLTLLDTENRSNDDNQLPRRAETTFRADLDRQIGRYRLGATLVAQGSRYDDLANTEKLAGYGTLDLRAEYEVTRHLSVQGRVENLFDQEYETAAFFNQPDRSFFVSLRYQP